MITLLEDSSPYYSKLYFKEIQDIQKILRSIDMNSLVNQIQSVPVLSTVVKHPRLPRSISEMIINNLPFKDDFDWKVTMIFLTNPGKQSQVHRDGPGKFSLNIPFDIRDDKCIVKWYNDDIIENVKLENQTQLLDHPKGKLFQVIKTPDDFQTSKEMILNSDEAVLINTWPWHRFDNRQSNNQRGIVGIRTDDDMTYEQAKDKIFKYIG